MKNKKLFSTVLCGTLITAMMLTACGSETGSNENTANFTDTTFSGTVEEIDGNTVTISVSTSAGGQMGGQMGGSAPDMPSGDGTSSADGSNSDNSSSDSSASADSNASSDSNANSDNAPADSSASAPSGDAGSAPEKPDGDSSSSDSGSAPEKPADDASSSDSASDSNASTDSDASADSDSTTDSSDKGSAPSGSAPSDAGSGDASSSDSSSGMTVEVTINDDSVLQNSDEEAAEVSDIEEGDTLTVTVDEDGNITQIVIGDAASAGTDTAMGGGQSSGVDSYDALLDITEDTTLDSEEYASTGTDENSIHVSSGATATLNNLTVSRDSDDSTGGDNSSFYGVGAALLVSDGTAYVNGGTYTTDAAGGAGIFAYDSGTVYVANATINTTQNTSGGIHAAGGGTLYAWDLAVTTAGESSAAIRSDRGGGTMVVDGGTYTSNGTGSPAVYCTADITVNDATLTATGSEAVCIEGLNTLRLFDTDLTGSMPESDQNDCTWNVIVYQSQSGDSEEGNGTFSMTGGSITANNGGMFYTTNTESTFYLSGVDITYADENDFFLKCTGNSNARGWGSTGSNGAQCGFTADGQAMEGDVIYDSISTLDFYMENGSTLKGAFVDDETNAGDGGDGYANLYISSDSTWTVTGDSTVTNLYNEGTIVDESGNIVSIVGTDGTVYVEGTSSYTVTVTSYDTTADLSGATTGGSFSDYAVENPF